tara:strand:- start:67 stop:306 length:240 start_codon:yes stop_codon:yes gene_type:complete
MARAKPITMQTKKVDKIIEQELKIFERSLVATPEDRNALDNFANANNGSNDTLLTQMAVQLGYIGALKYIKFRLNNLKQ